MLYHLISAICAIGKAIDKAIYEPKPKPIPPNARFDWEAYYKDIGDGISVEEQTLKRRNNEYWTTKPQNLLVDKERYERDCKYFGKDGADQLLKQGYYKYKLGEKRRHF